MPKAWLSVGTKSGPMSAAIARKAPIFRMTRAPIMDLAAGNAPSAGLFRLGRACQESGLPTSGLPRRALLFIAEPQQRDKDKSNSCERRRDQDQRPQAVVEKMRIEK